VHSLRVARGAQRFPPDPERIYHVTYSLDEFLTELDSDA
jgi:hypothetical protein